MLTTVPPNMLPLSGAKTNGKFVPAKHRKMYYNKIYFKHFKVPDLISLSSSVYTILDIEDSFLNFKRSDEYINFTIFC